MNTHFEDGIVEAMTVKAAQVFKPLIIDASLHGLRL